MVGIKGNASLRDALPETYHGSVSSESQQKIWVPIEVATAICWSKYLDWILTIPIST